MDFVVAGFGVGALLMLLGFAMRDLGPLRFRSPDGNATIRASWAAMCREIGTVFVIGGLAVCLATAISLFAGAGDTTGSQLVMAIVALAVIGCGVWTVRAIKQYVAVLPERPARPRPMVYAPVGADDADAQDEVIPPIPTAPRGRPFRAYSRQRVVEVEDFDQLDEGARLISGDPDRVRDEPADEAVAVIEPEPRTAEIHADDHMADEVVAEDRSGIDEPAVVTVDQAIPTTMAPERVVAERVAKVEDRSPVDDSLATTSEPVETRPDDDAGRGGAFASPLLTDVGTDATEEPSRFRSRLLADIAEDAPADRATRGFSSAILADLEEYRRNLAAREAQSQAGATPTTGAEEAREPDAAEPAADDQGSADQDGDVIAAERERASSGR